MVKNEFQGTKDILNHPTFATALLTEHDPTKQENVKVENLNWPGHPQDLNIFKPNEMFGIRAAKNGIDPWAKSL